ncbi:hypothetical protein [Micromonospora sp. SH-82]|uniref:hypothetical protein n=1 Tax=Micromonospora sp. SH-82 TaxID=3132938 RepID=UPI003EB868E9
MRLLVHVAGEADLLLDSRGRTPEVGAHRVAARRTQLATTLAGPAGARTARRLLTDGAWHDQPFSTPAPSPLFGALATLHPTPDLDVVVLGTAQNRNDSLDTLPIAQTLTDLLNQPAADDDTHSVRKAATVAIPGMTEKQVAAALTAHLCKAPRYEQTLLTWGTGSTSLALGVLTALSQAGLPWQLLLTSQPTTYEVVDPLDGLDADPVAGVLVRWRMFAALDAAANTDPSTVFLTDTQRRLVQQAAERHRAGFEARDCASLRAVVADAVVRRDGTANLAVRRYITSRYEELLNADRKTHPNAVNLLSHYEWRPSGSVRTLGQKLGEIRKKRNTEPVCSSVGLSSYAWLTGEVADALRLVGNDSHLLRPPGPDHARLIGDYLTRYDTDGSGWQDSGLPDPPVTPAHTVLAVWLTGVQDNPTVGTVGQQLIDHGLPVAVTQHLGVVKPQIRAAVFGVNGTPASVDRATDDVLRVRTAGIEAWTELIGPAGSDSAAVEQTIESRISRDTAALLFIPTGYKPAMLTLLRALRRVGAKHGLPLFVRQNANDPGSYLHVHLWPALTGGDLPLLAAAKGALHNLELDVAWRLMAASAIDTKATDNARMLADTFASRDGVRNDHRGQRQRASDANSTHRTTGMIAQRLTLVRAALTHAATPPERIRLLVLAADAMEASIAARKRSGVSALDYRDVRGEWRCVAARRDGPQAVAAQILLLLNTARDRAPITHGTKTDPDAVVAEAAHALATKSGLSPTGKAALPQDVPSLLQDAVDAALCLSFGHPDSVDDLLTEHKRLIDIIDDAIRDRTHGNRPPEESSFQPTAANRTTPPSPRRSPASAPANRRDVDLTHLHLARETGEETVE